MKANKLIIIALILTLSVVQIQSINIFNPYSETAKKYRCMSKTGNIARVAAVLGSTTAANYEHCKICRADKDSNGKNLSPEDGSGEDALGTFALRPKTKKYDAQIDCQKTLNEDKVKADYDSEHKIPRCELYDHYGQCVRCMIGYGLQWNSNALNGEEQGAYQCIDNQYRTPYCHKYDSSNKCIECKWNIDPEMIKLYQRSDTASDQSYELDFALYEFKKVTYCINNRQKDPQLTGIDDDMTETKIVDNCASYDSDRKCQRCHSRKFNLEGFKQYHDHLNKIDDNQNENYKKPIHDYILNKQTASKPICSAIPAWFQTKPEELDLIATTIADSKCGNNKVLKTGTSEYGCGTKLNNCETYAKDWDAAYFQEQGVWVYKITGCQTCDSGYALNESTLTCTEIAGDLTNCKTYNDGGCTSCTTSNEIVRVTKDNKILAKCESTKNTITNCPDENVQLNSNDKKRCTRCKPGFIIERTDDSTDDVCTQITSYMQNADSSKYEEFKRGCTMINDKKVCIQDGGNLGYSENSKCAKGLLYDNVLCKTTGDTISGCEEYINVEGNIRCVKCESDRQINYSGTQCLATTSNNDVKNCAIMDGPWCRRCLRDQGTSKDIHYELTQWNTCVQIKSTADQQCVYRNYRVSTGGDIEPIANCLLCTDKYYVKSGTCTLLPQYVTGTNTEAILLLTERKGDRATTWAQGVKVDNCLIHEDLTGKCFQCDRINGELYGVDDDGKCEKCANGQTVKVDGTVIKCSATVSETNNPVTDNCLKKDGTDCEVCEFGYERFISSTGTDECRNLYSYGCSEIQSDTNQVCNTCVDPFVKIGNVCVLRIENCINQTAASSCALCEPGYEAHGGKCLQKTELCLTQDWGKSWDSVGNNKRANVCKTCFNIDGNNKDFIRLFKKGDVLYQGCLSGCEDQKLYRTMSNRSDSNPYYLWSCQDCRNKNYHYYNTETRKQCEPAGVIANCNLYVNNSSNGDSLCHTCDTGNSIKDAGKSCEPCSTVTNCNTYDNSKAKSADGHCICTTCDANFYLSSNECKAATTVSDCKTYSNSEDKCTECNANFFLSEGKCTGFTATNCATKSTTANECLTCIANHAKNDSGSCVELTGISNCKTYETSKLCKECDDGYGLNHDRTGCLDNSKTDEKRSQKCFQYGSTDVDDIDRKNQYPVCIKCYEGFALDYDHDNLEKQCVKAAHCLKGRFNTGNHITADQHCQICKTTSSANKLVYKTKNGNDGVCQEAGTDAKEIDNCRVYVDYTIAAPKCYDCHDAYSPDSNDNTGSICISDDHPGALPGCKFYDNVNQQYGNAGQTGWLKYEWLKCKTCEHEWRYHSAPADTAFSRYNYNTYTRDCDIVTVQAITLPAANTWSGKDGGLRTSGGNNPGTGDDDKPLPSDDREQYEDPVVFANILSYSAILLLIVMSVL